MMSLWRGFLLRFEQNKLGALYEATVEKYPVTHQGLYQITLGNAQSLLLDEKLGNFTPGKEADFVIIDTAATPLLERRMANTKTLEERLFVLMMLESMVWVESE